MGKLNVTVFRYLQRDDFRTLRAVELGMKDHELMAANLVIGIANLQSTETNKILKQLCHHRLLQYDRGKRYDGYRLTNLGYDYLALYSFVKSLAIESFGNQIGTGKEANVYLVKSEFDEIFCLKLHRLGRICFRNVKEKRDYHGHRHKTGWLYLSRIAAVKEYAYMIALKERGFPIPKPLTIDRHCILMEYIQGNLLNHVHEIPNVDDLYDELMNLIVKFANHGVIHGDFNEFNIILTEENKPIVIDFPQMVSIDHRNAEMYFNRDVNCIRNFFRKRFGYESDLFPQFKDIIREDELDVEVTASGYIKSMYKDNEIDYQLSDVADLSSEEEELEEEEINQQLVDTTLDESKNGSKLHFQLLIEGGVPNAYKAAKEKVNFDSEKEDSVSELYFQQSNQQPITTNNGTYGAADRIDPYIMYGSDNEHHGHNQNFEYSLSTSNEELNTEVGASYNSSLTPIRSSPKWVKALIRKDMEKKVRKQTCRKHIAKGKASASNRQKKEASNAIKESLHDY